MTAKSCKWPKCLSVDELLIKVWYTLIMENYSAIKRNELLIYRITCMGFQGIMLNGKRPSQACILYDCMHLIVLKWQNDRGGEQISSCWWEREGDGYGYEKIPRRTLGMVVYLSWPWLWSHGLHVIKLQRTKHIHYIYAHTYTNKRL